VRVLVGKYEERDHLEDVGLDVKIMLLVERILKKSVERVWSGMIWLKIGTSGGFLCRRYKTSCSTKMRGIV
jgi:hypothetical protein